MKKLSSQYNVTFKKQMRQNRFHSASDTIEGIESLRMIQKGQITGQTKNSSSFRNFANLMVA